MRNKRPGRAPDSVYLDYVRRSLHGDLFLPVANFYAGEALRSNLSRARRWLASTDPDLAKPLKTYATRLCETVQLKMVTPDYDADPAEYPFTLVIRCTHMDAAEARGKVGPAFQPAADSYVPYTPSPERQAAPPDADMDTDHMQSILQSLGLEGGDE